MREKLTGRQLRRSYIDQPRRGEHIWWISDSRKFALHYPGWRREYDFNRTTAESFEAVSERKTA